MHRISFLLFVWRVTIISCLVGFRGHSAEPILASSSPPHEAATSGKLYIRTENAAFGGDGPIKVECMLLNDTRRPITFEASADATGDFWLEVRTMTGGLVRKSKYFSGPNGEFGGSVKTVHLAPGEYQMCEFDLRRYFDLQKAQSYTLRITRVQLPMGVVGLEALMRTGADPFVDGIKSATCFFHIR